VSLTLPSSGTFSSWQPAYAALKIPTFPLHIIGEQKVPMNKGYLHTGLRGSAKLARKFEHADMLGTTLNRYRMVVDADTTSESVVSDVLAEHGDTPLITRTASKGGYHCWYGANAHAWKHYGDKRRAVRPDPDRPIDYLGAGVAVLPPSRTPKGQYEFIRGGIEDLGRLPPFRGIVPPRHGAPASPKPAAAERTVSGARNNTLFRACMRQGHAVANFNELLAFARDTNATFSPPMEEEEVMKTVSSVWAYTERGDNRFGQHGAYFPIDEVASLLTHQDAFILLAFLRAHNGPWATFMCTNRLSARFGWKPRRLSAARTCLLQLGYLALVRNAGRGHPALYQWAQ
jgi:hypothetical protein